MDDVQLEATDPAAVRLPDTAVRDFTRERYGEAGDALVPTPEEPPRRPGLAFELVPDGTAILVDQTLEEMGLAAPSRRMGGRIALAVVGGIALLFLAILGALFLPA